MSLSLHLGKATEIGSLVQAMVQLKGRLDLSSVLIKRNGNADMVDEIIERKNHDNSM